MTFSQKYLAYFSSLVNNTVIPSATTIG